MQRHCWLVQPMPGAELGWSSWAPYRSIDETDAGQATGGLRCKLDNASLQLVWAELLRDNQRERLEVEN